MNVIEAVAAKNGWGDESILERPAPPPTPSYCHCSRQQAVIKLSEASPEKKGMVPEAPHVACKHCLRPIDPTCRKRQAVWLRGLLKLPPEQFDAQSLRDGGLLVD